MYIQRSRSSSSSSSSSSSPVRKKKKKKDHKKQKKKKKKSKKKMKKSKSLGEMRVPDSRRKEISINKSIKKATSKELIICCGPVLKDCVVHFHDMENIQSN